MRFWIFFALFLDKIIPLTPIFKELIFSNLIFLSFIFEIGKPCKNWRDFIS